MAEQTQLQEREPIPILEAVNFTVDGETYRYERTLLTSEMIEMGIEVLEFKKMQLEKYPESFNEVTRSRGAEWRLIIASHIIRRVDKEKVLKFDLGTVPKAEAFVKQLPNDQWLRMLECIEDFFYSIERRSDYLTVSSRKRRLSATSMLSAVMTVQANKQSKVTQ